MIERVSGNGIKNIVNVNIETIYIYNFLFFEMNIDTIYNNINFTLTLLYDREIEEVKYVRHIIEEVQAKINRSHLRVECNDVITHMVSSKCINTYFK